MSHYQNFEQPFEIPNSWEWVRLDDICEIKGGKRVPQGKVFSSIPTPYIYIRVTNMKSNTISLDDLKYIDIQTHEIIKNYTISKKDLYLTIAGTIGAVGVVPDELDGMNLTENAAKLTQIQINKKFLMYSLLSTSSQEHFAYRFHQVAQPKLSIETASSTMIPIPPLAEQERIVKFLETTIEQTENIQYQSKNLLQKILITKSKILELAMQGKLVPQDPTDEPASEMLKRINPNAKIITDNPHSWNIPQTWSICRLGDIVRISSAKRVMKSDWHSQGVPFYRTREIVKLSDYGTVDNELFISHEQYEEFKKQYGIPKRGDIMLTAVGTIGKTYIVKSNDKFYYKDASVLCLSPTSLISSEFLEMLFKDENLIKQMKGNSKGTTVDTITIEKAFNYLIVLPPLKEQMRIVAKIEELYSCLDNIEASLQS